MKRVTLGSHNMIVLGTVQGLVKEKLKVRSAFEEIHPEVVALPISEEMLEGLEAVVNGEVKEVATNSIDDMFADHLKRFGEVQLPPPSLVEAFRLAKKNGIKVITLDMNEEDYAEAYTDHVSGYHFWKRIWNLSKLTKKTFVADSPEEFVVIWDAYASRLKGYASLEKYREKYMARNALKLLRKHERVLILVEYERMEGVTEEIRKGTLEPEEESEEPEHGKEDQEINIEPEEEESVGQDGEKETEEPDDWKEEQGESEEAKDGEKVDKWRNRRKSL